MKDSELKRFGPVGTNALKPSGVLDELEWLAKFSRNGGFVTSAELQSIRTRFAALVEALRMFPTYSIHRSCADEMVAPYNFTAGEIRAIQEALRGVGQ